MADLNQETPVNYTEEEADEPIDEQSLDTLSTPNADTCILKLPGVNVENTSIGRLRYDSDYIGFAPSTRDYQVLDPELAATKAGQAIMDSIREFTSAVEANPDPETLFEQDRAQDSRFDIPVTEETIAALREFFNTADASQLRSVLALETAVLNSLPGLNKNDIQNYLTSIDTPLSRAEFLGIQNDALENHYRASNREPNAYLHDFMNSLEPVLRCQQNDLAIHDIADAYIEYLEQSLVSVGLQEIGQNPSVDQSSLNRSVVLASLYPPD